MADGSVIEPTGPCEWCLTFEGRTKKGRPCCELRALALMPKSQRDAVLLKVLREDGIDAMEARKAEAFAEYKRWREFRGLMKPAAGIAAAKAALARPRI
jgi:hypothetical protein